MQRRGADALTLVSLEENLFQYALTSNHAWASYKSHQNPALFQELAKGQSPTICQYALLQITSMPDSVGVVLDLGAGPGPRPLYWEAQCRLISDLMV